MKRLVFITEVESVYSAVRTESLYKKQIRFVFKGLVEGWNERYDSNDPAKSISCPYQQPSPFRGKLHSMEFVVITVP
jgi:hypothetical protein